MAKGGSSIIAAGILALGGWYLFKQGIFSKPAGAPSIAPVAGTPNVPGWWPNPAQTQSILDTAIQSPQFGLSNPGVVEASAISVQAGDLSSKPYVLTDSQGNPIPGVT